VEAIRFLGPGRLWRRDSPEPEVGLAGAEVAEGHGAGNSKDEDGGLDGLAVVHERVGEVVGDGEDADETK